MLISTSLIVYKHHLYKKNHFITEVIFFSGGGIGLVVTVADVLSAPSTASTFTDGDLLAAFSSLFGRRSLRFESCTVKIQISFKTKKAPVKKQMPSIAGAGLEPAASGL